MKTTTQLWSFDAQRVATTNPGELVGHDVEATDGHIGKIDKASTDTDRRYLVVDTGFWIFGKKRMVPAGLVSRIDSDDGRVFIEMTKDQIKSAPDYDDQGIYSDDDYDSTFGTYYRALP
jgi:hypothetical protein